MDWRIEMILLFTFLLFTGVAYIGQSMQGAVRVRDDPDIQSAEKEFRAECRKHIKASVCNTPVQFYWGTLHFNNAGMVPFYKIPGMRQIIVLDRGYWNTLPYKARRSLVSHEMAHSILGVWESENPKSLMSQTSWYSNNNYEESFKTMVKENL
jgi:hypothetical protein